MGAGTLASHASEPRNDCQAQAARHQTESSVGFPGDFCITEQTRSSCRRSSRTRVDIGSAWTGLGRQMEGSNALGTSMMLG